MPADCVELAWQIIAYLLYSGNPLHSAIMLVGSGRNGKGTLLRVIKALIGEENIGSASLADMAEHKFAIAPLFGKLANIAGDIDPIYLERTGHFKEFTGGDLMKAEFKGRDLFFYTPWAVHIFSANKIPASADTTAGYLSRWVILPFPNSFEGREDCTLDSRLAIELPGILATALRRLPGLLSDGQFRTSKSATDAKDEFSHRVDQVRAWLHDCTEKISEDPKYPNSTGVLRTDLYTFYKGWCVRDGGKAVRASEFYDRLIAAGSFTTACG